VEADLADHEELGTAWLFDSHGDFVTNAHVINGARQLRIRDRNNYGYSVAVMGQDDINDVAVLRVVGYQGTPLSLDAANDVDPGDKLVVISSHVASGHGDIAYETMVALHSGATTTSPSTTKGVYKDMLRLSGDHIYKGNSGGPVLNDQGQVVGIATLSDADQQAISYAIPLTRVHAELQGYASG
jgi:S1-C subfamily serine protease